MPGKGEEDPALDRTRLGSRNSSLPRFPLPRVLTNEAAGRLGIVNFQPDDSFSGGRANAAASRREPVRALNHLTLVGVDDAAGESPSAHETSNISAFPSSLEARSLLFFPARRSLSSNHRLFPGPTPARLRNQAHFGWLAGRLLAPFLPLPPPDHPTRFAHELSLSGYCPRGGPYPLP